MLLLPPCLAPLCFYLHCRLPALSPVPAAVALLSAPTASGHCERFVDLKAQTDRARACAATAAAAERLGSDGS